MRSLVHLLNVLAARLEDDHGPKRFVEAIRAFAADRAIRRAEHRDYNAIEQRRIDRQRSLFACLPPGHAADRLRDAIMQRAYDLLWDGDPMGCDALIEFLPSADADKVLDAWSNDVEKLDEPDQSVFYKCLSG